MKLARIETGGTVRVAAVAEDGLVDLTTSLGLAEDRLLQFAATGSEARDAVRRSLAGAPRLAFDSVRFLPPIATCGKILGVGMNYRSFVAEVERRGIPLQRDRIWFYRPAGCISGPFDDVWLPPGADDLEYEAELAVVIERPCLRLSAAEVKSRVAGFMIANDLTLLRRVLRSTVLGKSYETHLPLGPWLATADEVGDPQDLRLRTWVNGELRQDSSTAEMIEGCYQLIEEVNAVCALAPGDIILTGTPTGLGMFQDPPRALAAGDLVKIEIERIGAIENKVVHEPPRAQP
jgi:2-keto-4-pentenoate hydratase/2-oxohepta-3-ene-1,7-dioic acid hydratase in catechol pathway